MARWEPTPDQEAYVLEMVTLVHDWLAESRASETWKHVGAPVHIAFSPGDGTCYSMMFTPPTPYAVVAGGEYPRIRPTEGVISMLNCDGTAAAVNVDGAPDPGYVASHLKIGNPCTVAAVGIVWCLMVGNSAEAVALLYAGCYPQLVQWDRTMIAP